MLIMHANLAREEKLPRLYTYVAGSRGTGLTSEFSFSFPGEVSGRPVLLQACPHYFTPRAS